MATVAVVQFENGKYGVRKETKEGYWFASLIPRLFLFYWERLSPSKHHLERDDAVTLLRKVDSILLCPDYGTPIEDIS